MLAPGIEFLQIEVKSILPLLRKVETTAFFYGKTEAVDRRFLYLVKDVCCIHRRSMLMSSKKLWKRGGHCVMILKMKTKMRQKS